MPSDIFDFGESAYSETVNGESFGPRTRRVMDHITSRVIGQDRAAERLARGLAVYYAGLKAPNKPINVLIFAGPTGVGKTLMAEELARCLIADITPPPLTLIDCTVLTEHFQISELVGASANYVGYGDTPKLAQMKIDEPAFWIQWQAYLDKHAKDEDPAKAERTLPLFYDKHRPYLSIILFDEVEKAHAKIHAALLNVVDKGRLQMANGDWTDFTNSLIIMTCNIFGREASDMLAGRDRTIGFGGGNRRDAKAAYDEVDQAIYKGTVEALKKFFPAEFVGRIRKNIIVFRALTREQCVQVMDIMLKKEQAKFAGGAKDGPPPLTLEFSQGFKDFLLNEGYSQEYGLRPMEQAVFKHVTLPMANAIESEQLVAGDKVMFKVDVAGKKPLLCRQPRPAGMIELPARRELRPGPDPAPPPGSPQTPRSSR